MLSRNHGNFDTSWVGRKPSAEACCRKDLGGIRLIVRLWAVDIIPPTRNVADKTRREGVYPGSTDVLSVEAGDKCICRKGLWAIVRRVADDHMAEYYIFGPYIVVHADSPLVLGICATCRVDVVGAVRRCSVLE